MMDHISIISQSTARDALYFVRNEYQIRTRGLLSCLCGISVRCRNARSCKVRGLLQSVLALFVTEYKFARLALHAPPDEVLAMYGRRGDDAASLHMPECVQKSLNDLGDPTPTVLAMTFASALLKSSVTCGSCCAWYEHILCSVARLLDDTAQVVFHSDPM